MLNPTTDNRHRQMDLPVERLIGAASYVFSEYEYTINDHRVASFLSLHAHLTIEHHLETL
jgi:hypothetical protein